MKQRKSILIFSMGAACYGFTPTFSKLGLLAGYSLGEITLAQTILATALLWAITLFKKPSRKMLKPANICKLILSGTLVGMTSILYYASLKYLPASIAIILLFQFVWIGIMYEWLFDKKIPSMSTLCSMFLTMVGVFFAANVFNGDFASLPLAGIIMGISSAFTYAGFIYVNSRVAINVEPFLRTSFMITGSLLLVILLSPFPFMMMKTLNSSVWLYSSGLALVGTVIPPLLFSISAPYLPKGISTILGSLELPVAVIMAKIVFLETIKPIQWFGILLIVIAISIDQIRRLVGQTLKYKHLDT